MKIMAIKRVIVLKIIFNFELSLKFGFVVFRLPPTIEALCSWGINQLSDRN